MRYFNQRGELNTGMLYIIVIMLLLFGLAYLITGPTPTQSPILTGSEVTIGKPNQQTANNKRLQLINFSGATITPPAANLCKKGGGNVKPEIIIAYSPTQATAVRSDGQIKVWVTDTNPLIIAPNEKISRNSGAVISKGDRDIIVDGFRTTPALYVFPATVDTNGTPYYPSQVRGDFNNGVIQNSRGMEDLPVSATGKSVKYIVQYVWDIKDLGITAGDYQLQFVIPDGATSRGIGCITIRVYDPVNPADKIPI